MTAINVPRARVRPSAWWYVLVPVVMLGGIWIAVLAGIDEVSDVRGRFHLIEPGERQEVRLEAEEQATVWAVWQDGVDTDSVERPAATVTVRGPDGSPVPFQARSGNFRTTWNFGSQSGLDLGTFRARDDGAYAVEVEFAQPGPLAGVGSVDVSAMVWRIARPALAGGAAGIALLIILLVLRGRSKRRIAREGSNALGSPSAGRPSPTQASSSSGPISYE